jgi:nucleolar pre-ribosomal-associated protein 1
MTTIAGSQFTYFYHILLLHLNTPHQVTQRMTTHLLERLLSESILFDHDPSESEIWLSALPRLDPSFDLETKARFTIQQVNLLSFLDDVVRRTIKTPYRYIEDNQLFISDPLYFSPTKPWEMISPLMSCVMEQFKAKILGELIATDAAAVVLGYIKRVVVGLAGKVKDQRWLDGLLGGFDSVVKEAKGKGQARIGLSGLLEEMRRDLRRVFTQSPSSPGGNVNDGEAVPSMIDQQLVLLNCYD